jgi:putative cell wall protein DAN4
MTTLSEIKAEYLTKALSKSVAKYGVKMGNGRITSLSDMQGFWVEPCSIELIALVDKKYLKGDKVQEEIPIEPLNRPEGFQYGYDLYTFTTPDLKADNLKVEVLERPLIGKAKVKFKSGQQFAVKSQLITDELYQSADGKYYAQADLPENSDDFCKERYSNEIKAERNARISDTDDYVKLPDITVARSAGAKRSALEEVDRVALEIYRQRLRDLTDQDGFPFVEWPIFPTALAYELQQKINARQNMRNGGF